MRGLPCAPPIIRVRTMCSCLIIQVNVLLSLLFNRVVLLLCCRFHARHEGALAAACAWIALSCFCHNKGKTCRGRQPVDTTLQALYLDTWENYSRATDTASCMQPNGSVEHVCPHERYTGHGRTDRHKTCFTAKEGDALAGIQLFFLFFSASLSCTICNTTILHKAQVYVGCCACRTSSAENKP